MTASLSGNKCWQTLAECKLCVLESNPLHQSRHVHEPPTPGSRLTRGHKIKGPSSQMQRPWHPKFSLIAGCTLEYFFPNPPLVQNQTAHAGETWADPHYWEMSAFSGLELAYLPRLVQGTVGLGVPSDPVLELVRALLGNQ